MKLPFGWKNSLLNGSFLFNNFYNYNHLNIFTIFAKQSLSNTRNEKNTDIPYVFGAKFGRFGSADR